MLLATPTLTLVNQMLQPCILAHMQHAPANVSANAAVALVRDLLSTLVAVAIVGDLEAAAAASQQVLRGAGSIARELAC